MSIIIIVFILLSRVYAQFIEYPLKIGDYENVTTKSCGLSTSGSVRPPIPPNTKCFKWHKTIIEKKRLMAKIKYGRLANIGEVPYTVYLNPKKGRCTGAIVSEIWVLTAGHCVFDDDIGELMAYSGNNVYRYPHDINKVIFAVKVIKHEYGDIALVKLSKKIVPNSDIPDANAVCLPGTVQPDKYQTVKSSVALLSGWGYVDDYVENNVGLKVLLVKIERYYGSSMIISSDNSSGYACRGDSGGPLVQYINGRAVLIGVQSYTVTSVDKKDKKGDKKCGQVTEMQFTSVTYYVNWIIDTIRADQQVL